MFVSMESDYSVSKYDEFVKNSEPEEAKTNLFTDDLKVVSHKAIESAKAVGSFLYNIVNKTGHTISKTAKTLEKTLETKNILDDFNKEQKAFVASKDKKSENEYIAPWIGEDADLKQQILFLSSDKRNFLRSPPAGVSYDFDFNSMYPMAKIMLKEDPSLGKMRFEIVPKQIKEDNFWRNYFYRISLIKQSSEVNKNIHQNYTDADSAADKILDATDIKIPNAAIDTNTDVDSNQKISIDGINKDFEGDHSNSEKNIIMQGIETVDNDEQWEEKLQELNEYEVVAALDTNTEWESEIEQLLDDKNIEVQQLDNRDIT